MSLVVLLFHCNRFDNCYFSDDVTLIVTTRGVGSGGPRGTRPPSKFQKTKRVPFSGRKVPFAFVKNVLLQLWLLRFGAAKQ
jgi:hypothetical protein